jgi:V/A-type H+-transporting ATPase subunit E
MTGLEKILKAIEEDASANAEAILAEAQKEADEITSTAKLEAEKKCIEITAKSASDVKAALSRAESAARLQEKETILDAKQHIISNIITSSRNSIDEMSVSEYTELMLRMITKYAHKAAGIIFLSAEDKKRLPSDFEGKIKQSLKGKTGASLTISEKTLDLKGGFVLKYDDIEENCSFDAMFSAEKEKLQDKVNKLLFE